MRRLGIHENIPVSDTKLMLGLQVGARARVSLHIQKLKLQASIKKIRSVEIP